MKKEMMALVEMVFSAMPEKIRVAVEHNGEFDCIMIELKERKRTPITIVASAEDGEYFVVSFNDNMVEVKETKLADVWPLLPDLNLNKKVPLFGKYDLDQIRDILKAWTEQRL